MVQYLLSSNRLTIETIETLDIYGGSALSYAKKSSNKKIAQDIEKYIEQLKNKSIQSYVQETTPSLEITNLHLEIAELKQRIALMELKNIESQI